jgi:hypothetical protein
MQVMPAAAGVSVTPRSAGVAVAPIANQAPQPLHWPWLQPLQSPQWQRAENRTVTWERTSGYG